ncbi:MAG: efflux transporter periplasmic adaptor subunit [Flavobacteriales bacterium]|nr:efflux transporter periplasmic adaptor subunit [Flavobacteriales bacterium]|tara:strand:- start:742 stop:2028 length:1287 start_codon:yes stop_codon:yes gene_type:complete
MIVFILFIVSGILLFYFGKKKERRSMRISGISLFVLGLLLLIAKSAGWISSEEGISIQTTLVDQKTIIQTVSASGKIQPEVEVKISPDVSGEIVQLYIMEGDQVEKGDLLLKIKPDTYQSILDRSKAALNTSKSALAKAKAQLIESQANFNRNQTLFNKGTISQSEFEKVQASYTVAQLNVEDGEYAVTSAEASLKEAQENLNKTNIYAPISGTISRLNVELGERVVGTAQMAGTELLRLANLNRMEVAVEVNENDINSVNLGDTAIIEVDAFLGEKYKGLVSEIANSANVTGASADQVTNFEVKVRIIKAVNFRPGMTATVDIQSQRAKDVLALPIQAVTTRKDTAGGDEKIECVFEYQEGIAKMIVVQTGIQDDEYIQILSGVKDNMEIVKGPYSAVSRLIKDGSYLAKADGSYESKGSSISISVN